MYNNTPYFVTNVPVGDYVNNVAPRMTLRVSGDSTNKLAPAAPASAHRASVPAAMPLPRSSVNVAAGLAPWHMATPTTQSAQVAAHYTPPRQQQPQDHSTPASHSASRRASAGYHDGSSYVYPLNHPSMRKVVSGPSSVDCSGTTTPTSHMTPPSTVENHYSFPESVASTLGASTPGYSRSMSMSSAASTPEKSHNSPAATHCPPAAAARRFFDHRCANGVPSKFSYDPYKFDVLATDFAEESYYAAAAPSRMPAGVALPAYPCPPQYPENRRRRHSTQQRPSNSTAVAPAPVLPLPRSSTAKGAVGASTVKQEVAEDVPAVGVEEEEHVPTLRRRPPNKSVQVPVTQVKTLEESVTAHNWELCQQQEEHLETRTHKTCAPLHPVRKGHRVVVFEPRHPGAVPVVAYYDPVYLSGAMVNEGDQVVTQSMRHCSPGDWIRHHLHNEDNSADVTYQVFTVARVLEPLCDCETFAYKCDFFPKILRHATESDLKCREAATDAEQMVVKAFKKKVKEMARHQTDTPVNFVVEAGILAAMQISTCEVSLCGGMVTIAYQEVDQGAPARALENSKVPPVPVLHYVPNSRKAACRPYDARCYADTQEENKVIRTRVEMKTIIDQLCKILRAEFHGKPVFIQLVCETE